MQTFKQFVGGAAIVVPLITWFNGGNIWVYDRWWDFTTGRKLAAVDRLVAENKPSEALKALREHLKEDPTDRRLLYRTAGLYLEMGRPLPALVALTAYYDEARESEAEQKSERFKQAKEQWEFLVYDRGTDDQVRWRDNDQGGKTQVRIKNPNGALLRKATARWNESVSIYNDAPQGWRKLTKSYTLREILREPVLRTPLKRGLLDPRALREICFRPDDCLSTYLDAKLGGSLANAVAYGSLSISSLLNPSCCDIDLDDPDLRPMDDVVAEYFAARNIRSAAEIGKTPASLNELLELNSRLAIKHLFVLNYVYNATSLLEPKRR